MPDVSILQGKLATYFTLGCKLNFAETSTIAQKLAEVGVRTAGKGERADICITLPVWKELNSIIRNYLDSVKLDQFKRNSPKVKGKIPNGKSWNCGL